MNHSHFLQIDDLKLHYLDYNNGKPPLLLLHSLSGNAFIFQGLIAAGLNNHYRLLIPDLRGRGFSDHPVGGYSLEQEARDLIAFIDKLGLERVALCGHSFGGLLAIYLAAHYPERVTKLILLDTAVALNPLTPVLISYATARLLQTYPSWEFYLSIVRKAPFMYRWDASMLPFLQADVKEHEGGYISPRNNWIDITQAALHVFSITEAEWRRYISAIEAPTQLFYASDPYVHGQHIVPEHKVRETIALLKSGEDIQVEGNHLTLIFGNGARQIVQGISATRIKRPRPLVVG